MQNGLMTINTGWFAKSSGRITVDWFDSAWGSLGNNCYHTTVCRYFQIK